MATGTGENDSQRQAGGWIPGAPGIPAFTFEGSEPSVVPVLIAAPHAGRAYPRSLLDDLRHPDSVALRLEDRYVDRIAQAVARETGAGLLLAQAPRAMIDLNRAPDDIDWDMFGRGARPESPGLPSRRARSGLGLIPRRLPGVGELWRRRHERADLAARIEGIHQPYHEALARELASLRERWGAALLLDLHSMPPLPTRIGSEPPRFVIGDRFGATCHGSLIAGAFSWFAAHGCVAAHNRPYAGGYVLERHAAPAEGIHAVQLEVDRTCYLDSRLSEPGPGMAATVELLSGLVRRLAAGVSELGGKGFVQAAE
ncbi:N-formylglutamate amidohydrolase [Novosphingobium sp. PhB165]|uniref:N-formylglutamate amidohydrolase n=1 Tax=Novosphingobium sp. PhB165 TaxID=2485105 RepID=UPI001053BAB1|nr:N-formylglutamate amidohydrolase [Novosphingobium sp. PhB165]